MKNKIKPQAVKPSPLSWSVEDEGNLDHDGKIWIVDPRGLCVAELEVCEEATIQPDEAAANAALIVRAVNAHAELVRIARNRVYASHDHDCKAHDERKTCDCGYEDARIVLRDAGEAR